MIKSKDLFKMHVLSDFTDLSRTFRHCMCVKSIVFVVAHYIVNTLPTLMRVICLLGLMFIWTWPLHANM